MRSPLFVPLLALSTFSTGLAIAVLACAARSLHTFNLDQGEDAWLLPIWRDHFDTRDMQGFLGAGAAITLTSLYLLVSTLVVRAPSTALDIVASGLGTVAALIALILSNVLARQTPEKDTLQTWTCSWISNSAALDQGLSPGFSTTCRATRMAFYGIIPLFLLQLALVTCVLMAPILRRRKTHAYGGAVEKGHSLDSFERQSSWDALRNSPKSTVTETVQPVHGS